MYDPPSIYWWTNAAATRHPHTYCTRCLNIYWCDALESLCYLPTAISVKDCRQGLPTMLQHYRARYVYATLNLPDNTLYVALPLMLEHAYRVT